MGWVVKGTPRPLCPREGDPVPLVQEAGWAPGLVYTGVETRTPTVSLSPDHPARSESLYLLSYPVLTVVIYMSL
jgi:hypothetical protein